MYYNITLITGEGSEYLVQSILCNRAI